jgi:hypothetical protein
MSPRDKTRARRPAERRRPRVMQGLPGLRQGEPGGSVPAQEGAVLRPAGGVRLFFHPRSSVFICGSNVFRPARVRPLRANHRISNRNIPRLEHRLTLCKQTAATESNRNKTRHCDTRFVAASSRISNGESAIRNYSKSLKTKGDELSNSEKSAVFPGRFRGCKNIGDSRASDKLSRWP